MVKQEKGSSTPTISCKFPTFSHFKKIIDPIINSNPVIKDSRRIPEVPGYLNVIKITNNPFSDIKIQRIKEMKNLEQSSKDYEKKLKKDFSVFESTSRDTRIKYNASYELKKLKYDLDVEDIRKNKTPRSNIDFKLNKFVSNYQFLVDKRQICLLDLAVNIKEDQCLQLDEIIKEEEEYIKKENSRLQQINEAHDQYLKIICQNTSDAIKLSEVELHKRNKVAENVKRAQFNMAHLNAECIKLEEEYIKLKTYKVFLKDCYKQKERKDALKKTSLMNELKLDALLMDIDIERNKQSISSDSSDSEFKMAKFILSNINNANDFEDHGKMMEQNQNSIENNNTQCNKLIFNKEQLVELKDIILMGFSNSNLEKHSEIVEIMNSLATGRNENHELDERDLDDEVEYFNDPQDLVNILTELEINNLSLIENVQEQEEMCDQMKQRIEHVRNEMNYQISAINNHISLAKGKIANLEESINCIKETEKFLNTFNDIQRYKKLFYFGDLDFSTPDEITDFLYDRVSAVYYSVFEKVDSSKNNTIEMVKGLEILVDAIYVELISHDKTIIFKAKKQVDERKRRAARIRQKQICKNAEEFKIQKAMANALLLPRFHTGRKVVCRSDPLKEHMRVSVMNVDDVKSQEENAFFFKL